MNTKNLKFVLAPLGVCIGIALWIILFSFIADKAGISEVTEIFKISRRFFFLLGVALAVIWLPIFIAGIYFLGRRGAVGQSDILRKNGIYKYARNPMYSGISFTIIGIGLILNKTGVVLAGAAWFLISMIQCKREEKELKMRFGAEYENYRNRTPMFFLNVKLIMRDLFAGKEK